MNLPAHTEINNNNRIQMGGVQFIPSRLPSGEFALVMPNSGNGIGSNAGSGSSGVGDCGGGNSSSSTPDHWKPYPMESLSLRQRSTLDIHETAIKHSAFSNVTKSVTQKYLVDTSPLSPASSMSSIDDSSSSMNQMDLQTSVDTSSPQRTPQKLNLSAFPTPPSGGSISLIPTSYHSVSLIQNSPIPTAATMAAASTATLQQPHVTSTTEQQATQKLRPISLEVHLKDADLNTITMEYEECNRDAARNNTNKKRPRQSSPFSWSKNDDNGIDAASATASANNSDNNIDKDEDDVDSDNDEDSDDTDPRRLKLMKPEPKDYAIDSDESNNNNDNHSAESCSGDMWRPW